MKGGTRFTHATEATVRTGHGTTDWFQIGQGVRQGCVLSPCLLNLYAEYIMRNARLEEAQAGIKIARKNINNLRCADDTTLMAGSEEQLFHSSFTFIKRLFSSSSLSAIRVVSSAYLRLLIFFLAILLPACASSSLAFLIMYSAYKLNKQGDNI